MPTHLALSFDAVPITCEVQQRYHSIKDAAVFAAYLQKEETLIFDGVEQRIQRPGENEAQKDHYSGEKSVIPSKPSR